MPRPRVTKNDICTPGSVERPRKETRCDVNSILRLTLVPCVQLCHTDDMRPLFCALGLCFAAPDLHADDTMSAAEFDAYTKGKTFYYATDGAAYGAEEYLSNRRVRWSFLDGECKEGRWYEDSGLICFVYDDRPEPQCWSFLQTPSGLVAQFENDPAAVQLYEVEKRDEPLACPGPEIGV